MSQPHAVLLIACPDAKGIVATVADFVFQKSGNIVHSDHHTDVPSGMFYMRVEWELEGFSLSRDETRTQFGTLAERFDMEWSLHCTDEQARVAIMTTKAEHCLWDLLLRHRAGELNAELAMVLSNHPDHQPIAESFSVPFFHVAVTKETKREGEDQMLALLAEHRVDLVVLARYMQILTPNFVEAFPRRVINVHHSFLPAFVGAKPYHQAHKRGVKLIGASCHYVSDNLDEGPIITQEILRTSHRDSVKDMIRKGRDVEKLTLARAVMLHLQHRVLVVGNKTVVFE